jgi:hypothetical protein
MLIESILDAIEDVDNVPESTIVNVVKRHLLALVCGRTSLQ